MVTERWEMFAVLKEFLLEGMSPDDSIMAQSLSPSHDPDCFNMIVMH